MSEETEFDRGVVRIRIMLIEIFLPVSGGAAVQPETGREGLIAAGCCISFVIIHHPIIHRLKQLTATFQPLVGEEPAANFRKEAEEPQVKTVERCPR